MRPPLAGNKDHLLVQSCRLTATNLRSRRTPPAANAGAKARILERYPPTDVGRPGVIHSTPRGEKREKKVREMDVDRDVDRDAPGEVVTGKPESWRMTFEFCGNENALEELVEVAD